MRTFISALPAAVGLALMLGAATPAAQELVGPLMLTADRLPPGTTVTVSVEIGKVPNVAAKGVAAAGEVELALSLGSLAKSDDTRVEVYLGDCANNEVRVWIMLQGNEPPDECKRRRIGAAFWINRSPNVTVHYPGTLVTGGRGFLTPRNLGIVGGGAAAVIIGLSLAGDDDEDGDGGFDYTTYNGTYTGTGTAVENGCNFFPQAPLRGVLALIASGTGTWVKTHTTTNVTFNVPVSATRISGGISFTGSIPSQTVGSQTYSVSDTASIVNGTLTLTQVFTRLTGQTCVVRYAATMTKGAV